MHLKAAAVARLLHSGLLGLALAVIAMAQASAQQGFDRPGGDYTRFVVPSADPAVCSARCDRDARCRAWTFSYPNTAASGGANAATCWLKHEVTPPRENRCCVSGVKGGGLGENRPGPIENAIDRYGGDYRNFELKSDDSDDACKAACAADNKCRAWTYARPGYAGKDAHCFLKKDIKPPRRKAGFISGVVR